MKITCISDTHGDHRKVTIEPCDILIHSGDFMGGESFGEFVDFLRWLEAQPATHKVLIAGNHDKCLEQTPGYCQELTKEMAPSATYLEDSGAEIMGLKFWGSPYTPRFFNWAFNVDRGEDIKRHWDMIPDDVDVLVTHGPPYGFLDLSNNYNQATGSKWADHLGCEELAEALGRRGPKLHCFGHIHGSGGRTYQECSNSPILVNASIMDENYMPTHKPVVVVL